MLNDNEIEFIKPSPQDLDQAYILPLKKKSPYAVPDICKLNDQEWTDIELDIKFYLEQQLADRSVLDEKLKEYQRALDGEESANRSSDENDEFDGCKLRSELTASSCRIVETKAISTLLIEPFFMAEIKGNKEQEALLRDYANQKCKIDFDYRQVVRQIVKIATESPVAIIVPGRSREVRRDTDFDIYTKLEEFKAKYPTAEDAGMTEAQYKQKLKDVADDIEEKNYHECLYEYDVVVERDDIQVVHLSNFVKYPFDVDIDLAKLVGHKIQKTFDQLVRLERDGILKNVSLIPQKVKDRSATQYPDVVAEEQNIKTGIAISGQKESYDVKVYTIIKGLIRLDIDKSGLEKDYEFWYLPDEELLVRLAPYVSHYKKRNYILATIWKKTNSWLGCCIAEQSENPQLVLDVLLRQMIDSNALANVPEWVGNIADKETMESTRQDMIHRRGKIWWFKNPGSVQSLMTQRIDMSAYLNLVQQVYQGAESKMGASRSAAGQTLSEDPTAPGVKTMALLQQSDAMIAMYIDELKPALDEMMKFLIKQDRQYMKLDKKKVLRTAVDSSQYESEVSRDDINFLDSDVKFVVRNQNVDNNMAIKAREAREDLTTYLAVPSIGSRPQSVRILLRNDMMAKGRYTIDEINQIVPTEQELQAEQVEIQRLAMVAQQKQEEAAQLTQGVQDMASKQQDEQMAMMKESMGQPAGTETPPAVVPPTA